MPVLGFQVGSEIRTKLSKKLATKIEVFDPVHLLVEVGIVVVAIEIAIATGSAEPQSLARDWTREREATMPVVASTISSRNRPFESFTRLLGVDDDGAANCVATIESALRTAQNFDALQVEKLLGELP